ncbi:MAG: DUF4258 domain-containing protein [Burkholderiales bacterium]|nr:DUF4258 domain-containing protein [Burkholderiales bacterium]
MAPPSIHRLSSPQIERLIRDRATLSANVVFVHHALVRMRERAIMRLEVLEVLRQGRLRRAPEPDPAHGSLKCLMQRFIAGRELGVVAAVSDDDPGVVVVTVVEIGG